MKKIMMRAWEIVRNAVAQFGGKAREYMAEALRMAWAEAKEETSKEKFEKSAKVTIIGREHYGDDQASKFVYFNLWEKYGKRRVYVNDYKRRTCGYIDCETMQYIEQDGNGLTHDQINAAVANFLSKYELAA